MMRCQRLEHCFVELIPEQLELGVLYISLEHRTVTHTCCCGCGEEVVTPLSPVGWQITFDGESVSLWPSVGSWTLRCGSHYMIDRGQVLPAPPWSKAQITAGRERERAARARHFGTPTALALPQQAPPPVPDSTPDDAPGWWTRLWRRLFGAR